MQGLIYALHYNDVIMSALASQITGVSIVCSMVGSGADQRKHQSSASLAYVRGIHRWQVNSPNKKASKAENVSIIVTIASSRLLRCQKYEMCPTVWYSALFILRHHYNIRINWYLLWTCSRIHPLLNMNIEEVYKVALWPHGWRHRGQIRFDLHSFHIWCQIEVIMYITWNLKIPVDRFAFRTDDIGWNHDHIAIVDDK